MFRAHRAHHQERQIVSIQPLVPVTLCQWPCRLQTCAVAIISCSFLHRMRNGSDKNCTENENTHFIFFENRAIYETMWKNIVELDWPQMTMWHTHTLHSGHLRATKWLRWSGGSVLAFGTQVRGFEPGQSCWSFQGEKILSTPSFGGEVKLSVPCRRFTACKRFLNATWKSGISGKIHRPFLAHIVPLLATRISGEMTSGESWNV